MTTKPQGLAWERVLANLFLVERTGLSISSCPVAGSNLCVVEEKEEENLSCFSGIGGVWVPVFWKTTYLMAETQSVLGSPLG